MLSSFIFFTSFGYANDLSALQQYLESIDKPKPGIERLNIKNIDHKSYMGWVCTYKERLEKTYAQVMSELKQQRALYEKCNFSLYVTYLFDKKEFNNELLALIKQLHHKELSPYNYMIRDEERDKIMTVSFVCANCEDSQSEIKKNITMFVQNTCQHDPPDIFKTKQVEALNAKINELSQRDQKE